MSQMWKIVRYDGGRFVYERIIPYGSVSRSTMILIIQRLAARHLDDDEVVDSSLRKNAKEYLNHLEVQENTGGTPAIITMGTGHPYTASITEGKEA